MEWPKRQMNKKGAEAQTVRESLSKKAQVTQDKEQKKGITDGQG